MSCNLQVRIDMFVIQINLHFFLLIFVFTTQNYFLLNGHLLNARLKQHLLYQKIKYYPQQLLPHRARHLQLHTGSLCRQRSHRKRLIAQIRYILLHPCLCHRNMVYRSSSLRHLRKTNKCPSSNSREPRLGEKIRSFINNSSSNYINHIYRLRLKKQTTFHPQTTAYLHCLFNTWSIRTMAQHNTLSMCWNRGLKIY